MPGLRVEWDAQKELGNRRKHAVDFPEVVTVFGDPLSITTPDPDHSAGEDRYVVHTEGRSAFGSLACAWRLHMKEKSTKKPRSGRSATEMRVEYDFAGGVRGKYAQQYRHGTNMVLLDPELTSAFPDSKSVNDALRALLSIANRAKARVRM